MNDDVREAAERLREFYATDGDRPYGDPFDDDRFIADRDSIIEEYLAERPADDDTPVDEAWLQSVGFKDDDQCYEGIDYLWINNPRGARFDLQFHGADSAETPGQWRIADEDNALNLPRPKTRGAVRRLAAALGIPLVEQPAG